LLTAAYGDNMLIWNVHDRMTDDEHLRTSEPERYAKRVFLSSLSWLFFQYALSVSYHLFPP
jgi:hypothetical protein